MCLSVSSNNSTCPPGPGGGQGRGACAAGKGRTKCFISKGEIYHQVPIVPFACNRNHCGKKKKQERRRQEEGRPENFSLSGLEAATPSPGLVAQTHTHAEVLFPPLEPRGPQLQGTPPFRGRTLQLVLTLPMSLSPGRFWTVPQALRLGNSPVNSWGVHSWGNKRSWGLAYCIGIGTPLTPAPGENSAPVLVRDREPGASPQPKD